MTIFQHRDGELRLYAGVTTGSKATGSFYFSIPFVNEGFTAPIKRPETTETLVMDRGVYTADAEYRQGLDEEKLAALPLSFTIKTVDDTTTQYLIDGITGTSPLTVATKVLRSTKGESKISGISTPQFGDIGDSTSKFCWDVEVLWDGTSDLGYKWREVNFQDVNVTEGVDEVTITANGLVYGDVTRVTAFRSGSTILGNAYSTGF